MIVVVNPNNRIRSNLAAIEPPLWAGLIASYHHAQILDAEAMDWTLDETEVAIRDLHPDRVIIVVMGNNPSVSSTPKMPVAASLANRLPDLNVFLTGIHPIAVKSDYRILTKPFEGFPNMPFDQLPMVRYRAHNWHCLDGSPRSPYASVYTSLGCPFNCYYCNVHALYGDHQVRFRPVENIIREIDTLVNKYQVRNIKIWDELFALNENRVLSICDGLKDYDLNIWAYARVDTVTERMLKAMKEAGINWLAYGFESADTQVRSHSRKRFTDSQVERAIRMTEDAGISIIANIMFGLPGDTPKTMQNTLDWAKGYLFEWVNFYEAKPYPGSQWYEDIKPQMDWDAFDQYGIFRMLFRDYAFNDYFNNPAYLEMISEKFEEHGMNVIRDMLETSPIGVK